MEDLFCTECIKRGVDITCTGNCHRSFHQACLKGSIYSTRNWVCPDCEKRVHRCNICKEFSADNGLMQCRYPGCYKYYHSKCIPSYCSKDSFYCPLHRCALCKRWENCNGKLVECVRCCKAYHKNCLPLEVFYVSPHYFACSYHRTEDPPLPSLTFEVLSHRHAEEEPVSHEEGEYSEIDYYRSLSVNRQESNPKRVHY